MYMDDKTTAGVKVPEKLIDQVIGQEKAVKIIKKAAAQKRNVLLVGTPGTGKSLLAQAMSELLPTSELEDILVQANAEGDNNPAVKAVKAGEGRKTIEQERMKTAMSGQNVSMVMMVVLALMVFVLLNFGRKYYSDVIIAAGLIMLTLVGAAMILGSQIGRGRFGVVDYAFSKLLIDSSGKKNAPFIDATGARAGALLGDVKHDPFQCIPGDELVHLPTGKPVKISELIDPLMAQNAVELDLPAEKQIQVLAGSDSNYGYMPATVKRVFKRQYCGELIEITTRRGHVIQVTPNHPIATLTREGDVEYVKAGEIIPSQSCILPRRLPTYAANDASNAFLLLLADALADGHIGERNVLFKLKREFKIKAIEENIRKAKYAYTKRERNGITLISINNAELVRKLRQIGAKASNGKHIPELVFSQTPEKITAFLSRYLSLDGHVGSQGQFELQSKELIPELIPLFYRIGVIPKRRDRLDPGFKKGNMQPRIIFSDNEFAKAYAKLTINPIHAQNLAKYFKTSGTFKHVSFTDIIPLAFSFLEKIRVKTGLSKTKVHEAYYALNEGVKTHTKPTRQILSQVVNAFLAATNGQDAFKLRNITQGTYDYDQIENVTRRHFSGPVYNLTTTTGNYLVNCVLTHNSGGLGTPAHLRVEPGAIHKAHRGILFIDEVSSLAPKAQQELLTAMQEKKYAITGQSDMSSGALVRTQPVPCDFVLVAAGNYNDIRKMHPALRSRIRGYGYEVYMDETIQDTPENRLKLVQFVAQEVKKDGKIPHFDATAIDEVILEARKRAGRKNKLTLKLRELGGLVRAAGDLAKEKGDAFVSSSHVADAKKIARTLEQQAAGQAIELKKDYQIFASEGMQTGKVNGLAVMADSGVILPIVAEVAPALSREEGKIIATGKLGDIAKEAVENVSAIIKKHTGKDTSSYDIHVQFLQTYEGVEGDSASISVATAVISALEDVPVRQDTAMTGSLSVRGEVLPVGGVTQKIEAAMGAGLARVIIPASNSEDVLLPPGKSVEIIPVKNIYEVLTHSLKPGKKTTKLLSTIKTEFTDAENAAR